MADMSGVIKSFQVMLNYVTNEESRKKFEETTKRVYTSIRDHAKKTGEEEEKNLTERLKRTEEKFKHFYEVIAITAVGVEETIRRTTKSLEDLFWVSQRTGVSAGGLADLGFSFSQLGMSATTAQQQMQAFAVGLRDNPTLEFFAKGMIGASTNAEDALNKMVHFYHQMRAQGPYMEYYARQIAEMLHFDPEVIRQLELNIDEFDEQQKRAREIREKFFPGKEFDEATKRSKEFWEASRVVWDGADMAVKKFVNASLPGLTHLLKDFGNWMVGEGADQINLWADRLEKWLKDPATIEAIEKVFHEIWTWIKETSVALGKWFDDKDNVKQLTQVFTDLATILRDIKDSIQWVWEHKDGLAAIIGALGGAAAGAPFGPAGIAIGAAAGAVGASLAVQQLTPERQRQFNADWATEQAAMGPDADFNKFWKEWNDKHPAPAAPPADTAGRPHSYAGPPMPTSPFSDPGTTLQLLWQAFQHWWSGSGNFRPYVQLIDDFYDRFQDMLMDTFDTVLKAMGYKEGLGRGAGAEGPGGPGGGPGGGFGPEGRVAMPQNIKLGMAWLMKEKGLTAEQAGGIMGWMQSESGFNPRAHNDIGGGHTGIMQWDRGRWRNYLENFLPTMQNKDPYDFMNQLKFWWHEQETTEKQYGVIAKLRAAQTALQANYAVHFTERSGNMYQGGRAAQRIAEQYRGGIPDETTTASAGGYPMPVRDIMGRVHAAAMGMHKGIDIVLGDSIGHGIADAIGAPRDAIDGRSPEAIYNSMMTHLEDFRNKNVALASGSNWGWRPEQQEYFRKTVQKLHSVGAHIALVNISGAVHGADQIMAQERAALGKGDWYAPGGLADTDYRHVHPIHGGAGYHRIAQQLIDQSDHSTNNYIIHEAGDPHGTANAVVALKNRHHQRLRHNHIRKLV